MRTQRKYRFTPTRIATAAFILLVALHGAALARAQSPVSGQDRHSVTGTVTDPAGATVAGATVRINGGSTGTTRTDDGGRYSLEAAAGPATLTVEAGGFSTAEKSIDVSTGLEVNVSLRLAPVENSVTIVDRGDSVTTTTTAGTKTEGQLLYVPQAVSIVGRPLLDSQGALKLDEALKNVAGVMPGGYYQDWDYYRIRGFDAAFTTYINGVRAANGVAEEVFGLERVEVLKGPSSAAYGQGTIGGIVNIQSKRPKRDAFADIEFTTGSFGILSPSVDLGGSLNEEGTVYGRIASVFRSQSSFVDFVDKERLYVAPSLTWEIGPATSITLLARHQKDKNQAAFPLPAAGTVLPNRNGEIDISRYIGEPDSNIVDHRGTHVGYQFSHRFNDSLSIRQNLDSSWYWQEWTSVYYPAFLDEDERTLYRFPYDYESNWRTFTVDTVFDADFETGFARHDLLTGVEYYRYGDNYRSRQIDYSDFSSYLPIDLFTPVYGQVTPKFQPWEEGGEGFSRSTGIYVQDQIRLTNRLRLLAGGRIEFSRSGNEFQTDDQADRAFTPWIGVSFEALPGLVAYGNYSRSFNPQYGRVFDGTPSGSFVDPEGGAQWEAGLKSTLADGRVDLTAAYFHLERSNVATNDPAHPNFYLMTGKQRSRGLEFEASLLPLPGWTVTSAYSLTDAEVTEDNDVPVGTRTQNVPRHAVNFWSTYEVQRSAVKGLGFGLGLRHYSDQSGDLFDSFSIPAYGLMDASVFYRKGPFRAQVNFYNLTDERYFLGSYDALYVQPGDPRNVRVTFGWSF